MSNHDQHRGQWGNEGPKPPEEKGIRLATFDRSGPKGEREEMRVTLDEYSGHPYVGIRLWTAGRNGYWPSQKGVTIRRGELDTVISALRKAVEEIEQGAPTRPANPRAERERQAVAMMPAPSRQPFDEFDPE